MHNVAKKVLSWVASPVDGDYTYRRIDFSTWRGRKMAVLTFIYFTPILGKIAAIVKNYIYIPIERYRHKGDKEWVLNGLIDNLHYMTEEEFRSIPRIPNLLDDNDFIDVPDSTGDKWRLELGRGFRFSLKAPELLKPTSKDDRRIDNERQWIYRNANPVSDLGDHFQGQMREYLPLAEIRRPGVLNADGKIVFANLQKKYQRGVMFDKWKSFGNGVKFIVPERNTYDIPENYADVVLLQGYWVVNERVYHTSVPFQAFSYDASFEADAPQENREIVDGTWKISNCPSHIPRQIRSTLPKAIYDVLKGHAQAG